MVRFEAALREERRRRTRWMAAHDRIRLTGRLRERPLRGPLLLQRRRRPAEPTRVNSGLHMAQVPVCGRAQTGEYLPIRVRSPKRIKKGTEDAYCPHCHLLIERKVGGTGRRSRGAARTAACWWGWAGRGPRRRQSPAPAEARPGSSRTRPGARAADGRVSKQAVCKAIREVAKAVGARPERLLMVDYQQQVSHDDDLPGLDEVFAAYGSWKRARRAAATGAG